MVLILIYSLVFLFIISIILSWKEGDPYWALGLLFFLSPAAIITICWLKSGSQAQFLNKVYDTNYTQEDLFWNEDLIKAQLMAKNQIVSSSQNLNINGNLSKDLAEEKK